MTTIPVKAVDPTILVSECFGPTLQGEGPSQGRRAVFIRLGLCNLDCSWCDTPFTWDWTGKNGHAYDRDEELTRMPVEQVADLAWSHAGERTGTLAVVTGGEPFVQRRALADLCDMLLLRGLRVEIETNGTQEVGDRIGHLIDYGGVRLNVSPKLYGSGTDPAKALKPDVLRSLVRHSTAFKFVVTGDADIREIEQLVDECDIPDSSVWLMPEGRSVDELAATFGDLFDYAAARGWNATHRLHVLAHGDKRGV